MKYELHANVWKEGEWFVAAGVEVEVTSQGKTKKSALKNLKEAFELWAKYADPDNLEPFSRIKNPELLVVK